MTINDRFLEIIKALYGGNKAAFAEAIGVAPTVIQNVVGTRQGKPSFEVVAKVCALANINTGWVISGNGEMLASKETVDSIQTQSSDMVNRLIDKIEKQAEEIGRLKERNAQLQHRNAELETELSRGLQSQTDSREFTPQYESQKV